MTRLFGAIAALTIVTVSQADGQVTRVSGWTVRVSPAIDLWYHALAVVQLPGIQALPMDARGYAQQVTETKRAAGLYPTELDDEAKDVRESFEDHPSFEALHLIPTLFPDATPERMIEALLGAVEGEDAGGAEPDVALGIAMVAQLFRTSRERKDFRKFVELVEAEWSTFYEAYWNETNRDRHRIETDVQSAVDDLVQSSMALTLQAWRVQSGIVFVSRAVGPSGRISIGDAINPADNVVVVRLAPENAPTTAAVSLIRELCVPNLEALVKNLGVGRFDPYVAAQASGRGAVLCGARVVEDHLPEYAQRYRDVFVPTAPGMDAPEFEQVFAVDPRLDARIDELVGRRRR